MLNSIGLDNDGIETFLEHHMPYLRGLERRSSSASPGERTTSLWRWRHGSTARPGVAAIELNISCPNVSHGVDFGTDPAMCERVVAGGQRGLRCRSSPS